MISQHNVAGMHLYAKFYITENQWSNVSCLRKNYDTSSHMFSVPILFSTAGCHSPSLSAGGLITEESEGEVARRRILPPLLCLFSLVSRTLNQLWLIMI